MCSSDLAIRGVIEGYYGRPWTHAQRLRLIDELGACGMNAFVYGPKDDPLVRAEWRRPYDGEALERLRELVDRGRASGMEVAWCISPGLSIRYADAGDGDALIAKIRSVAAIGVTRFGLLLDDIPGELRHAEDRAAFPDLASAHVALIGRVFAALRPDERLIVCPTVYRGTGDDPYLATLAAIDPRIDCFWTGRAICSPTLDLADAAHLTRVLRRPPTYWDNYPVNDVAMGYELHVGPYRGRDPLLWRASAGVIANGMELFESSRIPFRTIADYLADPEGYDPEASWARAIRAVAKKQVPKGWTVQVAPGVSVEQRVEAAMRGDEIDRALLADARHAGDVVAGVPDEREDIDHLRRLHPELVHDALGVKPGAVLARVVDPYGAGC